MENKENREVNRLINEIIETLRSVIIDLDSTEEQRLIAKEGISRLRAIQMDSTLGVLSERSQQYESMLELMENLLQSHSSLRHSGRLKALSANLKGELALAKAGGSRDLP